MSVPFDPTGLKAWYVGVDGPLSVAYAYSVAPRITRVHLTTTPRSGRLLQAGDASNALNWSVARDDGSKSFLVLSTRPVDGALKTVWDIYTLQDIDALDYVHRVSCLTLKENDSPFDDIVDPKFALFGGCIAPGENPYQKTVEYDVASDADRGVFSINSSGDLAHESGETLLRKLVRRRLFTSVGGFLHLPEYGVGLHVKEMLVNSDLLALQADIERQVAKEPELSFVRVRLRLTAQDVLYILVKAIMSNGQSFNIEEPVKQIVV